MRIAIAALLFLACACATVQPRPPQIITRAERCWSIQTRSTAWSAIGIGASSLAGANGIGAVKVEDEGLRWGLAIASAVLIALAAAAFDVERGSVEIRDQLCEDAPTPTSTSSTSAP